MEMKTPKERPIDRVVDNVLNTEYEDIDPSVIEQAKLRIIDTTGCLIGGATDPGNRELVDLVRRRGGTPESTVLIYGHKLPAGFAAMLNCILCRSFDFEPVSPVVDGKMVPAHISGTNVMTALTLSEHLGASGKELITSMLVGDDMTARVLAVSGFDLNLGWDGNGTANAFGATAIAGRLLGLTHSQLRNAFGLVLNQMAGSMQNIWDGTPAFRLPQGGAAENGVFSAQLAKAGWTGPNDPLFSPNGYYALYTNGPANKEVLTKDLGNIYYADRAIKPYPGCRATHAPIGAAISFTEKHEFEVADIREVKLFMAAPMLDNFCGKPLTFGPFPHADAAFSYQYTVAVALMNKCVTPEHYSPEALNNPALVEFARKVTLNPSSPDQLPGIDIKVLMNDGTELSAHWIDDNKGDFIDNPLSEEEFHEKYIRNVGYSRMIPINRAEKVFSRIQHLEAENNLTELIQLLVV